jgi:hypothetical protein
MIFAANVGSAGCLQVVGTDCGLIGRNYGREPHHQRLRAMVESGLSGNSEDMLGGERRIHDAEELLG